MNTVDPRRLLAGRLLAISDDGLAALEARLELASRGVSFDPPPREAASRRPGREATIRGASSVIRIHGPLTPRETWLTYWVGGTAYDVVRGQVRAALADTDVAAILLDIDSPGGDVEGLKETATLIHQAHLQKPVIAAVSGVMASAAYYLGSQATEIHLSPSAMAGSIGTVLLHVDTSKLESEAGVTFTYIYAGKYKVEGNAHEPLSSDARAHLQRESIDPSYREFVDAVAAGRHVPASTVEARFGQGRMLHGAAEAIRRGMADAITAFDDVLGDAATRGPLFQRLVRARRLSSAGADERERVRRWIDLQEMELQVIRNTLPDEVRR